VKNRVFIFIAIPPGKFLRLEFDVWRMYGGKRAADHAGVKAFLGNVFPGVSETERGFTSRRYFATGFVALGS
jgi:hypothetical protein